MADGFGALYLFATPADFARGLPAQFRQAFGIDQTGFGVASYGAFVNDHWSAARRLAMDLGVRYDFERLPHSLPTDAHNISPRIGLAYQPAPQWVVRAGYGIFFYDRYVLAALNQAIQKSGATAFEQVVDSAAAAVAFQRAAGGPWPAPLSGVPPSVYAVDRNLATSYSQQASLAAEHELAHDLTASATFLLVRGVKLSRMRNLNLLAPGPPFGPGRANPRFDDVFELEDSAGSTYQGATFSLNRRLSQELEFSASYTLSKTLDDASDFTEQPQNPFALAGERALSRQDQRHRLVVNGLWELPIGDEEEARRQGVSPSWLTRIFEHLEIAPILSVESGRPVDPLMGVDNGSHPYPLSARPPAFGRNSLRTPLFANVDFRLLKYFPVNRTAHLDLVAEAFNLFNRTNVIQINPVFGTALTPLPGFTQPITGSGARQIQFSLDFEF